MNTPMKWAGMILLLLCGTSAYPQSTQRTIGVDEAITMALQNNLQLQSKRYTVESSRSLSNLGYELPPTALGFQYGQFNSINNDNYFAVEQAFPMPGYFNARSDLYTAELKGNELAYRGSEMEIKTTIRAAYDQLRYIEYAKKELSVIDSLYVSLVDVSTLRYTTGETNLVEKTAAEMKLGQIRLLLAQYESEYQVVYSTLKMWMNTNEDFTVDAGEAYTPMNLDFIYDTAQLVNHPYLLSIQQQAIIADAQVNLQRKAVSPDLQAGYFNQSIIGVQNVDGTDISYSGDTRFQGFNVGIRLPIFFTGNKTKIESLTAKHQAMVMEAEFSKEKMQTELYSAFQKYYRYVDEYDYYRETTLPNADQLLNAAKAGYTTGDTGYLEYIIVVQFVSDTRIRFLERIHELNQTIFQIQYLLQQ